MLFKSDTAQYSRQITNFWMNQRFSCKLAFSTEYRDFELIPPSIRDLVLSRGKRGVEENQHTHMQSLLPQTWLLQLQPTMFYPKLLSGCPLGVVGQVFQTRFLHLGPRCHSSCTLQHPTLPLSRAILLPPMFHILSSEPLPQLWLTLWLLCPRLAEGNTKQSNNWERELAGEIRSIMKAGATPTCSSWLCYTNTNCLPSGLPCLRAGSWESKAGSFDPNFSAAVQVMAFTVACCWLTVNHGSLVL